ncbi:MAG: ribonuclease Z [Candidatus Micrarchaeota archaeon]|nr:ribonuclease Z [Candidatus Micrarchaeota archaeon]
MEIKVIVLGSSGSAPTKERALPCVALIYNGELFLFDCGEGTQMQMLRYGVNASRLKAVFLSHAHADHMLGIAGLVRSLALSGRKDPLDICIPKGYENAVKTLASFDKAMIGYQIRIHGVGNGIAYRARDFSVSSFALKHTIPTCGYIFRERDRLRFNKEKSHGLGIKGTMFSELEKKGSIRIGRKVIRIGAVTKLQRGKAVVYAADTRPVKSVARIAKGADLLIHESSYADEHRHLAAERMHSSASDVARIAKTAGVKQLILTHISARYKSAEGIEKSARKVFGNTVVADDGYSVTV